MEEEQEPAKGVRAVCLGCGGSGLVNKPRLYLSLETGEPSTVIEQGRCPHCRKDSGFQDGGLQPPV